MANLTLRNVTKSYGNTAVIKGVDLDIADGEFCVFVGPSGCGKSTLLRMIAGLEEISSGEVQIGGRLVNDILARDRGVAMVFQSYALYPHMSVYDNMGFALKLARAPQAERDRKVREAARILQMEDLLDRKPAQLSGGQRQRVAIGRAIVRAPDVFLFDEPLSNLDAKLRVQMRLELARLHKELGRTMIYVTHDQIEAMTLASRIVVLDGGRVSQVGSPLDLYARPKNRFVAGFIGSPGMNFISAEALGFEGGVQELALPGGGRTGIRTVGEAGRRGKVELGIRPEHLTPVAPDSADAILVGQIALLERLGQMAVLYVTTPAGEVIVGDDNETTRQVGDKVGLSIVHRHAHLFDADGNAF